MINDEIRNALNEEEMRKEDLQKIVYTSDVITMLQDGLYKVLDGTTSFEEIYRIIDIDDDLDMQEKLGLLDNEIPSNKITESKGTLPPITIENNSSLPNIPIIENQII